MTFFGKMMVMLVTVGSLSLLTWATGVYTQRVNWFPPEGVSAEQAKGRVQQLRDRINVLMQARQQAEDRWASNHQQLVRLEALRGIRQQYYAGQLQLVQTGVLNDQKVSPAVQKLDENFADPRFPYGPPTGRNAETGPDGQPLLPITDYVSAINAKQEELQYLQGEVAKLVKEQEELSNRLIDQPDRDGLRTMIDEQYQIARESAREQEYLLPYLTNRRAEVALVKRRQNSLQARVDEVKQYLGSFTGR